MKIQASSQAAVTQLWEKANTRSYKVRWQEQLGKKRSGYFHSGETVKEASLGRRGSLEHSTVTLPAQKYVQRGKVRCR